MHGLTLLSQYGGYRYLRNPQLSCDKYVCCEYSEEISTLEPY
jgi:hypothetical protein